MLFTKWLTGVTDDEIVNKWFDDLCKGIVLEIMDTDVLEELKAQQENREKISKTELKDGKVEYS